MAKADVPMSPVNPGAKAKEVLVIKLSALGDFVLALGAMKAVREMHPSARITLLTTPFFEEFAKLCPYVDRIEADGRPEGMKATGALIQRIRKMNFDIVYDFQTSGRTKNYFTALSRSGKTPLWSGHHEPSSWKWRVLRRAGAGWAPARPSRTCPGCATSWATRRACSRPISP
jgi:hypothetical protein